jgi:hypothetical protein
MLHLISLDKRVCHSKCNYFVPLLCKMDEEENRNSSYDPFHTVARLEEGDTGKDVIILV